MTQTNTHWEQCKFCDLTHHYKGKHALIGIKPKSALSQLSTGMAIVGQSNHTKQSNTHSLLTELSSISEQDKQV
jgi:hypothetical protein